MEIGHVGDVMYAECFGQKLGVLNSFDDRVVNGEGWEWDGVQRVKVVNENLEYRGMKSAQRKSTKGGIDTLNNYSMQVEISAHVLQLLDYDIGYTLCKVAIHNRDPTSNQHQHQLFNTAYTAMIFRMT
jgi:hypothetical protein